MDSQAVVKTKSSQRQTTPTTCRVYNGTASQPSAAVEEEETIIELSFVRNIRSSGRYHDGNDPARLHSPVWSKGCLSLCQINQLLSLARIHAPTLSKTSPLHIPHPCFVFEKASPVRKLKTFETPTTSSHHHEPLQDTAISWPSLLVIDCLPVVADNLQSKLSPPEPTKGESTGNPFNPLHQDQHRSGYLPLEEKRTCA